MIIEKTANALLIENASHADKFSSEDYNFSTIKEGGLVTIIKVVATSSTNYTSRSIEDISLITSVIETGVNVPVPATINDLYLLIKDWLDESSSGGIDFTPVVDKLEEIKSVTEIERVICRDDSSGYTAFWVNTDLLIANATGETILYYKRLNASDSELNTDWSNRASLTFNEFSRL